ncbi:MAG TPA: hypothetical protein DCS87_02990 [Rheinheimera sp.]|nr:hypothetical protein [Rheinheimera sp.]
MMHLRRMSFAKRPSFLKVDLKSQRGKEIYKFFRNLRLMDFIGALDNKRYSELFKRAETLSFQYFYAAF